MTKPRCRDEVAMMKKNADFITTISVVAHPPIIKVLANGSTRFDQPIGVLWPTGSIFTIHDPFHKELKPEVMRQRPFYTKSGYVETSTVDYTKPQITSNLGFQ